MKNLCFYCEESDYGIIEGKAVNSSKLHTINLDNQLKEASKKGLIPVTWDLKKSPLSINDFESLPGAYEIITGYGIGPKMKGRITFPKEARLIKGELALPPRQDGAILVLGAKTSRTKQETGGWWSGITFWYCDPNVEGRNDDATVSKGLPILMESLENKSLTSLNKVPGWYQVESRLVRGRGGQETEKISNLKFVGDFDLNAFINQAPPPPKP